jgi:hypothetical protein
MYVAGPQGIEPQIPWIWTPENRQSEPMSVIDL